MLYFKKMKPIGYVIIFLLTEIPFQVKSQQIAIELDKMNVLYKFVPNPLKIVAENFPCDKVIAKSKNGKLVKLDENCNYIYNSENCNAISEDITVGIIKSDKIFWTDTIHFRLKDILTEIKASICGFSGSCLIDKKVLMSFADNFSPENLGIYIPKLINIFVSELDLEFKVVKYNIEISRNDSILYKRKDIKDNYMFNELACMIESLKTDDILMVNNITIEYGECEKKLDDIILKIK